MKVKPNWYDKELERQGNIAKPDLLEGLPENVPPERLPVPLPQAFECVFCFAKAQVLHRGTAYCRNHYDDKNVHGNLIN